MTADDTAADRALPLFRFFFQECIHALLFNHREVFHHAHVVFRSVAFIELFYPETRKVFTFKTETRLTIFPFFTLDHLARTAGFRLILITAPATMARFFVSQVTAANGTIHTAGRNQ